MRKSYVKYIGSEIVAKSDLKRGYKNKALKLFLSTIALIEQLAAELNLPQNRLVSMAVEQSAEKHKAG